MPEQEEQESLIQTGTLASMTTNEGRRSRQTNGGFVQFHEHNHSIINFSVLKKELMNEIRFSYTEGKYEECIPIETSAHMMKLLRVVLSPTTLLRILVWFLVYYFAYFFLKFAAILCMNSSTSHILKNTYSHIIREFWFTSRYWMGCLRGRNCDLDPFCGLRL